MPCCHSNDQKCRTSSATYRQCDEIQFGSSGCRELDYCENLCQLRCRSAKTAESRRCCKTKRSKCLGGGWDCRRCAKKVYHAELQLVSCVAYHRCCFSCLCCRKMLDSFNYNEHCLEIFCKQCYQRNFGPQGYGYGIGAGTLQTPL